MPDYTKSVARGYPGADVEGADHLCGAELERVRSALSGGGPITIACTQQAPLFREIAEDLGYEGDLTFANIRETAGWAKASKAAGAKAAALLAMAGEPVPDPALVTLSSNGVVLIYGCDEVAIEAGQQLSDKLDVTVILTPSARIVPHSVWTFPVVQGAIRIARGFLGAFELTVDNFAAPVPSSREQLRFSASRDGATSNADIILDLTGGTSLFPAHELRDGYIKADPGDRAAVANAVAKAGELVGEFDKPRYIEFSADLCAHSRSHITGCTRCLDLCPTGAITPAGEHVAIDPDICAGCGNCAAACPTGAAAYAGPDAGSLLRRLRTLLVAYREAGGMDAILLFHDAGRGRALIDGLARFGAGLPANVLPVEVNEITQLGIEAWTAPVAWGAVAVRALGPAKPRHDTLGLARSITIANLLCQSLGYGGEACGLVETDDPDALEAMLGQIDFPRDARKPATFLPLGGKGSLMKSTMVELHRAAPTPVDRVALPALAPFGGLDVNVEGCTLCLSCVSACPTGALSDNQQKPALYFDESACVQCGLCVATCPEKVITLTPQVDFSAWSAARRVVKEEEPFTCIHCGNPFGVKSTVERIVAKLEGSHWMFEGKHAPRLDLIRMCDHCRVEAAMTEQLDPYAGPARPAPRSTMDYLENNVLPDDRTE
jgi:ferredoxin